METTLLEQFQDETSLQNLELDEKVFTFDSNEFAFAKVRKNKMTEERLRKLSAKRLKEELRERDVVPPLKASKEELQQKLRSVILQQGGEIKNAKPVQEIELKAPPKVKVATITNYFARVESQQTASNNNNNNKAEEAETADAKRKKSKKAKKDDDSDYMEEEILEQLPSKSSKKRILDLNVVDDDDEVIEPPPKRTKVYDLMQNRTQVELLEELMELVELYGTKMANVVYYLRRLWNHTPDARVILFSQFDTVLTQVAEILNSNDIKTAFVTGNVMRKNKAINSFRNLADVQVILLGTEKAASGTTLIEASHIILMDPVTGSQEEVQAVESQAIGRADRQGQSKQITVVRFIVQNTLEQSDYIINYLEGKRPQFAPKLKDLGAMHKAIAKVNNANRQPEEASTTSNN